MRLGDISAEDYSKALLEQAGKCADLNAFRTLVPEGVLAAARAADDKRKAGGALGRMHGLPIPVKDSVNTRDIPTSNGTGAFTPAAIICFRHSPIAVSRLNIILMLFGCFRFHLCPSVTKQYHSLFTLVSIRTTPHAPATTGHDVSASRASHLP